LWVRLGGADKVDIIVDDFWDVVKADTELDDFRRAFPDKEQVVALKDKLKKYISLVSAGPLKSEDSTKEAFVGKAVTDKEFDSLSKHLKAVLTKSAVKDADIDEFAKKMAATRADNVKK